MKKLIGSLIAVALLAPVVYAGNPDQVPSVGLDFTQTQSGITTGVQQFYDPTDNTSAMVQERDTLTISQVTIDLRVPVSDNVSFTAHGGPTQVKMFGATNTGYSIGGGLRFFMPKSWLQ